MSTINIEFRGLCLFHKNTADPAVTVLLPNTSNPDSDLYRDKTPTRLHYATVCGLDANEKPVGDPIKLDCFDLTVLDENQDPLDGPAPVTQHSLISFRPVASDLDLTHTDPGSHRRVAARLMLMGAAPIVAHQRSSANFRLRDLRSSSSGATTPFGTPTIASRWNTGCTKIFLDMAGSGKPPVEFDFSATPTVLISNICDKVGEHHYERCRPGARIVDHDFKWYYELFEPQKNESWDSWLDRKCDGLPPSLPVPYGSCPSTSQSSAARKKKASKVTTASKAKKLTVLVSTCFPTCEGDDC